MDCDYDVNNTPSASFCEPASPVIALIPFRALIDLSFLQCGEDLPHCESTLTNIHFGFGFQNEFVSGNQLAY